jgi:hypothetical protein
VVEHGPDEAARLASGPLGAPSAAVELLETAQQPLHSILYSVRSVPRQAGNAANGAPAGGHAEGGADDGNVTPLEAARKLDGLPAHGVTRRSGWRKTAAGDAHPG